MEAQGSKIKIRQSALQCWKLKASQAALILKLLVSCCGQVASSRLLKLLPLCCGQAASDKLWLEAAKLLCKLKLEVQRDISLATLQAGQAPIDSA